jgi:two-component system, NarL family, response regulator LiaR
MKKEKIIKILVADDHSITREGIKTLLSVYDDLMHIGEAANGQEAVDACKKLRPDVVLMDMDMPILDGVSATRAIKAENKDIKILALTSFADKKLIRNAIQAGASGYIIKNISPAELAEAIRSSFYGQTALSPEATEAIVEEMKEPGTKDFRLTEQELKILKLLSMGETNKRISEELFISPHTVKFHLSNIFSKLGASTRAQAAFIANKNNLLQ